MAQKWTKESILTGVRACYPKPPGLTRYLKEKKGNKALPGTSTIATHFGSWTEFIRVAYTAKERQLLRWTPARAKRAVLSQYPAPLSSSRYIQAHPLESEQIPTYHELRQLFGSWCDIKQLVWGQATTIWTRETLKDFLLNTFPTGVSRQDYLTYQVHHPEAPKAALITRFFDGKWTRVASDVWGIATAPLTAEQVTTLLRSRFTERPTYETYRLARKEPTTEPLPSPVVIERLFGVFNKGMTTIFGATSIYRPVKLKGRYTDQELVEAVTRVFDKRPTYLAYYERSSFTSWLPSKTTLQERFGSFTKAMDEMYPESIRAHQPGTPWRLEEANLAVLACYEEMGAFSQAIYKRWQTGNPNYPSLNALKSQHQGDLRPYYEQLGLPYEPQERWTKTEVLTALTDFLNWATQSERPLKVKTYQAYRGLQLKAPSPRFIRKYFGSWREGLLAVDQSLNISPYQLEWSKELAAQTLRSTLTQAGPPYTTGSYQHLLKSGGVVAPSYYQLLCLFGGWESALEAAGLERLTAMHAKTKLNSLHQESKALSLQDVLNHCLS